MLVLVDGSISLTGQELLEARQGCEVIQAEPGGTAFVDLLPRAAGVIMRSSRLDRSAIGTAGQLRVVSKHGVGYDTIDVTSLTERGIPLTVIGNASSGSVAEHTIALLLATARHVPARDHAVRTGNYQIRNAIEPTELAGKSALVVGYGRIGSQVARLLDAFGVHVIVADPHGIAADFKLLGFDHVRDFRDALPTSDIITLHIPGQPGGKPVLGASEFARIKRGTIVINTARGSLIDETRLADALRNGVVAGAGLDVTDKTPPAPTNPLLALPNVVFSPHSAALTRESFDRAGQLAAQNVLDAFDGQLDAGRVVNPEVLN